MPRNLNRHKAYRVLDSHSFIKRCPRTVCQAIGMVASLYRLVPIDSGTKQARHAMAISTTHTESPPLMAFHRGPDECSSGHLVNAQKNGKMSPATLHYYEQQSHNSLTSVSTCAPSS